jgi:predicted secreted acid phosphatase
MLKRFLPAALATIVLLTCAVPATAQIEPMNLDPHKQELRAYIESGAYAKRIAEVALLANKYLVKRIERTPKPGKKLAIVFDIDETVLSNLPHILAQDFGYMPKNWAAWVAAGRAPAIIPVQAVYETAVRGKIDVFFITGRREEDRASTERNLREVGYETWTKIYFLPPPSDEVTMTLRGFKIDTRRKLEQDGYVIIANIGDQNSDLVGGYAERFFKLPNPFYLMP